MHGQSNVKTAQPQKGFTIVELLIVIVVIGILAAITIVAFNGIQNRAKTSAVTSSLSNASRQLDLANVENGAYPATTTNIQKSNDINYQYSYTASSNSYCLTATKDDISYKIQNGRSPVQGGCAGHGVGGTSAITNLYTNPSFETNINTWGTANAATVTRQTASNTGFGAYGVRVVAGNNTIDSGLAQNVSLVAGKTYTLSATVRAIDAGSYSLSAQGVAGTSQRGSRTLAIGEMARLTLTWTPTATGSAATYVLRQGGATANTNNFDVDGMMLVEGMSANYADGSSPNWIWNGTPHSSTSTGPAL